MNEIILGCLIITIISFSILIIYNIIIIKKFGIPSSLSESYYILNNYHKGYGDFFTGMMFSMGLTLLPAWLELGKVLSSWSYYLNPLAFFTCAAICFVGAAPAFRDSSMENKVHMIDAKTAAVCALSWCFIAVPGRSWWDILIPLLSSGVVAGVGAMTGTWKKNSVYWLEMMCFGPTFLTVITELIIQLCK